MDNRAYEQYKATQPVAPRPQRQEPEPLPTLSLVEITVILVTVAAVVYAVWRIIKDLKRPPQ